MTLKTRIAKLTNNRQDTPNDYIFLWQHDNTELYASARDGLIDTLPRHRQRYGERCYLIVCDEVTRAPQ